MADKRGNQNKDPVIEISSVFFQTYKKKGNITIFFWVKGVLIIQSFVYSSKDLRYYQEVLGR